MGLGYTGCRADSTKQKDVAPVGFSSSLRKEWGLLVEPARTLARIGCTVTTPARPRREVEDFVPCPRHTEWVVVGPS